MVLKVTRVHLIEERKNRQWSQQKVAELIGTTQINVSRWELGSTTPGPYFREKLCKLFGKDANELDLLHEAKEDDHINSPPPISVPPPDVHDPALPLSPYEVPHLIGRQALVDQLVQIFCGGQQSTVALTGLPGVGKTALAVALARHPQVQHYFRDGILWVGLGQEPQVLENMHRWGMLLEISSTEVGQLTSLDAWARRLYQQIGKRRMLLIIDDAWDLADAITFRLGGTHCAHLLTTRLPALASEFAREHVFHIPELNEDQSLILLNRAIFNEHQQPYPPQLSTLAHLVGGLPLALVLVGRYLHVQAQSGQPRRFQGALEKLQQNIEMRLNLSKPQAPGEHASLPIGTNLSLQVAIDISFHRLPEQAQIALQALSIFPPKPNSFSEEAALAVSSSSIDMLDLLVDSGLLENHQVERYYLHQTIADYLRLRRTDPEAETRLVAFFVEFICKHSCEHELLEQDLQNILAAFDCAHERQMFPVLIRGVLAFMPFISAARLYALADKLLSYAQHAAHTLSDQESLARIWVCQGEMAELVSNFTHAEQAYFTALTIARKIGHARLTGQILVLVGGVIVDQGDYARAEMYLQEGLAMVTVQNDQEQRSIALKNLGEIADNLGNQQKAQELYHQSLDIARQQQNWKMAGALLQNLGALAAHQGDDGQAEIYFQEGLGYARDLKDFQRQSAILMNQGLLACYRQDYTRALTLSLESLKLARKIGHRMRISSVLQNLGIIESYLGNERQAEAYLQESLDLAQSIGHLWLICETSGEWGKLYLRQQNLSAARKTFQKMLEDAISIGAQPLQAQALFGLAQVEDRRGCPQNALQYARESQALFQYLGDRHVKHIEQWLAEHLSS